MKIVKGFPPNYGEISKHFNFEGFNPIFAYGDKLYNPKGFPVSNDLMIHEETHAKQQFAIGVEQWWAMYLEKPGFRLDQEVEAYQAQYRYIKENFSRPVRRAALQKLAKDLSSSLYGKIISKKDAEELIDA